MSDVGTVISGRYRISGVVGHGSFTDVYKAEDEALGRKVVMKVLSRELSVDPRIVARFAQEGRMSTGLVHDYIGRVYDVGSARFADSPEIERPFLVVERVTGLPLSHLVERGALRVSEAVRLESEVLQALDYAHRSGVVHRDLKPANILVSTSGSVKVVDFGISAALTEAGDRVFHGDPDYAAPETRAGQRVDARSDLYSAGVLFFHMLTGQVPLPGGYSGTRAAAASSINARVPVALNMVVARALEPVPASRYQTAQDVLDDIARADQGVVPRVSEVPDVEQALLGVSSVSSSVSIGVAGGGLPSDSVSETDRSAGLVGLAPGADNVASGPPTETDELVTLFGRSAISTNQEFSPSLPAASRQRGRVALGLVVSLVFVVVVSVVTLWVLNIKPVDFFPSSARSIPNVVGYTYIKAVDAIRKEGLTPVRVDEASAKVPKGSVIRVDPSAKTSVDIGTRVTLYVSSGLAEVKVPDVAGQTVEAATAALTSAGFTVGTTSTGNSATVAKGLVLGTTPEPDAMAQAGSSVSLIVSTGLITIPDLVGKKIDEASSILSTESIMLTPSLEGDRTCRAGAEGITVRSQSVGPGDVPAGTPITLTYCAG